MSALYTLLQITDSLFPAGSFAHSGGLEALFDGQNPSTGDLGESIAAIFERHLLRTDGLLGCAAHRAVSIGRLDLALDADRHLLATKLPVELREASLATGRSFLEAIRQVLRDPRPTQYGDLVEAGVAPGNYAVTFQLAAAAAGVDVHSSLLAWAYQSVAQLTAASMRLGLLGHRGSQQVLATLHSVVERGTNEILGEADSKPSSFAPLLEIASMRHEHQYSRLFRS